MDDMCAQLRQTHGCSRNSEEIHYTKRATVLFDKRTPGQMPMGSDGFPTCLGLDAVHTHAEILNLMSISDSDMEAATRGTRVQRFARCVPARCYSHLPKASLQRVR